jgi:hypothetical protein
MFTNPKGPVDTVLPAPAAGSGTHDAARLQCHCLRNSGSDCRLGDQKQLRTGTTTSAGMKFAFDDNPIGFCLVIAMKAGFVGFAVAEIFHAAGVVSDPMVSIQKTLPFLPRSHPPDR